MASDNPLLAVLIDADNASYQDAQPIFEEIARFGEASVRRIYGDFSSNHMKPNLGLFRTISPPIPWVRMRRISLW